MEAVHTYLVIFFILGAIPWFITAELFSQSSRAAAVSIAGVANWLSIFVVGLVFPSLQVISLSKSNCGVKVSIATWVFLTVGFFFNYIAVS